MADTTLHHSEQYTAQLTRHDAGLGSRPRSFSFRCWRSSVLLMRAHAELDSSRRCRPNGSTRCMTLHGLGMVGLWFVAGMAGASFLLSRYVRPDARRLVDRLRRDARRASCCCSPPPSSAAWASAGTSSIRCRSTRAARGRRGRRRRCSPRSRSWASAGRSGPAICCGRSRARIGLSQALGWQYLRGHGHA